MIQSHGNKIMTMLDTFFKILTICKFLINTGCQILRTWESSSTLTSAYLTSATDFVTYSHRLNFSQFYNRDALVKAHDKLCAGLQCVSLFGTFHTR